MLWSIMPKNIKLSETLPEFKRKLKTQLIPCHCAACRFQYYKIYIYLNNCLVSSYIVIGIKLGFIIFTWTVLVITLSSFFPKEKDIATTTTATTNTNTTTTTPLLGSSRFLGPSFPACAKSQTVASKQLQEIVRNYKLKIHFYKVSGQFPDRHFPRQTVPRIHFPDGHFPDGQFPERTISRTDISPTDCSPNNISPNGHFPDQAFPRITCYISGVKK